jgi:hypothetical protein
MVTIGDSFAIVAIVGGICLSAWSLIMAVALVFPGKARFARERLAAKPWASFFIGFAMWATIGFASLVLLGSPVPTARLVGWVGILTLSSLAAIGSAGVATLAGERLRSMAPEQTIYASLSKSAATIVIAGLVPILGWFLIVPMLTFVATGSGVAAVLRRERQVAETPAFQP